MGYTKLFSHIITSSIWSEDDQTRILWITMLALSDKYGEVMAAIPGLAKVANLTIAEVKGGIKRLESPDEYSRTPDEEGRRIIAIPGGWHVVNYEKHRKMASLDDQRAKTAARVRRFREKEKRNALVTHDNGLLTHANADVTHLNDNADAESREQSTEAEKKRESTKRKVAKKQTSKPPVVQDVLAYARTISVSDSDAENYWDSQQSGGWTRNGRPIVDWKASLRNYKAHGWLLSQKNTDPRQQQSDPETEKTYRRLKEQGII